jgi:hypothetical protein
VYFFFAQSYIVNQITMSRFNRKQVGDDYSAVPSSEEGTGAGLVNKNSPGENNLTRSEKISRFFASFSDHGWSWFWTKLIFAIYFTGIFVFCLVFFLVATESVRFEPFHVRFIRDSAECLASKEAHPYAGSSYRCMMFAREAVVYVGALLSVSTGLLMGFFWCSCFDFGLAKSNHPILQALAFHTSHFWSVVIHNSGEALWAITTLALFWPFMFCISAAIAGEVESSALVLTGFLGLAFGATGYFMHRANRYRHFIRSLDEVDASTVTLGPEAEINVKMVATDNDGNFFIRHVHFAYQSLKNWPIVIMHAGSFAVFLAMMIVWLVRLYIDGHPMGYVLLWSISILIYLFVAMLGDLWILVFKRSSITSLSDSHATFSFIELVRWLGFAAMLGLWVIGLLVWARNDRWLDF